jgi:hypothetical protein
VNEIITLQDLDVEGRIIQLAGTFCGHFKIENREVTATVSLKLRNFWHIFRLVHMSRKEHITFVMSGRPSAYISAVPAGRITVKFDTVDFHENPSITPYLAKL